MDVVFVADRADRDLGLLADYFNFDAQSRIPYIEREHMTREPVDADLVILLGSNRSAHDPKQAAIVETEVSLIRSTLTQGVPVIGICFGAQVLARALGGSSHQGSTPECGWTEVQSSNDELCPPGLWAQMHRDVIDPAPTSQVIGWSPSGPQAFIDESMNARAIGWQFHPELTLPTFRRWLARSYSGSENADHVKALAHASQHAPASAVRARALFRATTEYLRVGQARQDAAPPTEAVCVLGYN